MFANVGERGLYLGIPFAEKLIKIKNINVIMIDPDESKTFFIKQMIKLNKLKNCIVLTCGVSDKECASSLVEIEDKTFHKSIINEDEVGTIKTLYSIAVFCFTKSMLPELIIYSTFIRIFILL